jgi:hypothetical protein
VKRGESGGSFRAEQTVLLGLGGYVFVGSIKIQGTRYTVQGSGIRVFIPR